MADPAGGGDRNFFAARREHEKQAAIHAKVCPELKTRAHPEPCPGQISANDLPT